MTGSTIPDLGNASGGIFFMPPSLEDFFMEFVKKFKKELILAVLLTLMVTFIFLPYVTYSESSELGIFAIFAHGFDWMAVLMFTPFILTILSIVFGVYNHNVKQFGPLAIFFGLIAFVLFVFSPSFYASLIGVEESEVTMSIGIILLSVLTLGFSFCTYLDMDKTEFGKISVYEMVEISLFVAIAIVLDMFAQIDIGATGGSIGFAMFPLMVITLRHGPIKGFIASGIIFGFITCLTDGYGFVYFPFDYLLGFGSIGLLGLFNPLIMKVKENPKSKTLEFFKGVLFMVVGVLIVCLARMLASSISSMVFYGYSFGAAMLYQLTYVPGACGASLVVLILLYKPLLIINKRYQIKKNTELD